MVMDEETKKPRVDIQQVLDGMPSFVSLTYGRTEKVRDTDQRTTVVFNFSEKGFGFGEFALVETPEGVFIDTECMSKAR
jgi:hypothetical protein